jgi:hypothetical protein
MRLHDPPPHLELKDPPMQILAGSLNVDVDDYLHAGYMSARVREYPYRITNAWVKLIDVKKSVELKDSKDPTTLASTREVVSSASILPSASMISDVGVLAIVFFFFAYLLSSYYRRMRKIDTPAWRPWLFAGGPMLVFVLVVHWVLPAYAEYRLNNRPPPWKDVPIRDYKDPQAATEAILHTLIASALQEVPSVDVRSLSAIQSGVAFPVAVSEYTPGMLYAQHAYNRDGWGREFLFEPLGHGQYQITSAGPDGIPGTADDIVLVTPNPIINGSENNIGGVYFRTVNGGEVVLIHRIQNDPYGSAHLADARKLTETDLFDLFPLDELLRLDSLERRAPGVDSPIVTVLKRRHKLATTKEIADELLYVKFEDKGDK